MVHTTFQHRSACVDDKHCLRASGGEVGRPAHRATELGRGAEACMPIEADLEAVSPGRAAAGDGRGGLAEGERAF